MDDVGQPTSRMPKSHKGWVGVGGTPLAFVPVGDLHFDIWRMFAVWA